MAAYGSDSARSTKINGFLDGVTSTHRLGMHCFSLYTMVELQPCEIAATPLLALSSPSSDDHA